MHLSWIILIANSVTMLITISAAIKRPIMSYRLIAGFAVVTFVISLHQVLTAEPTIYSLLCSLVLVVMMIWRVRLNAKTARSEGKR
jgi:hypothetical protein